MPTKTQPPLTAQQQALFDQWSGLVQWAMRRYARFVRWFDDPDDARQVAYMGLLKAVRTYDPTKGVKFNTYALVVIRHMLNSVTQTARSRHSEGVRRPYHLSAYLDSEGSQFDLTVAPEEPESVANPGDAEAVLATVEPRAAGMLRLRAEGATWGEIGRRYGLSKERARQVVKQATEMARERFPEYAS